MESLRVPATLESLKEIRDYVTLATSTAGLSPARAYGLALAVDEIATNIVVHGHDEAGRTGDIQLHAKVSSGMVEIMIEDQGIPFNPLAQTAPTDLDAPLSDRGIGGLGIFLAKKNVDDFRYNYVDGYNQNIFVIASKE